MSRRDLIEGYLDGQLSRRVFLRGLIATGVTAGAALSYATMLEAAPAGAGGLADFYLLVIDFAFSPNPANLAQGQAVEIGFQGDVLHTVSDTSGIGLFDVEAATTHAAGQIPPLPGAGSYPFECEHHPTMMKGKFKVPVVVSPSSGALGATFTVRWAVSAPAAGLVFDVQRKAPGSTTWTDWRIGTTALSRPVTPRKRGTWSYRARVRKSANGAKTGWSRPAAVSVT